LQKEEVYDANCELMQEQETKFIQKHCRGLYASSKAFEHKDSESHKTKERISSFLKLKM
jgi:hypothetical protein